METYRNNNLDNTTHKNKYYLESRQTMTNELEKQFFDTFEVDPFIYCSKPILDCDARKCGTCTKDCEYYSGVLYPQITDSILLELIKILSKEFIFKMFNNFDDDWALMLNTMDKDEQKWFVSCNGFKDALLSLLMNVCNCSDAENIKHQVRTLFEEGNEILQLK